ncbi:carbonic anhydrase [Melittangium boletus]|uniref:Carbonic anhydrase n=1 Tax=Melittangium boletus DSM 14713 TaxID=1294270 RepID=A0A250IL72_9BACT|nr:carbonic anhydrase [Melittangium boletus]ATB31980.1 carbonic anhydrase [Melittangium boletus DSM 14713]
MAANEIDWLLDGFRVFKRHHYSHSPELLRRLTTEGQSPKVAVVACCDSRVDPAIILDAAPGDLFVIRNVANLVPPCESGGKYHGTSAALEFAVRGLEVSQIIVLGHFGCGGIRALIEGSPWVHKEAHFLAPWITMASEARDRALAEVGNVDGEARQRACEKRGVVASLDNLMTFPWIQRRVQADKLTLHGWYFDLEAMALMRYDPAADGFAPLA